MPCRVVENQAPYAESGAKPSLFGGGWSTEGVTDHRTHDFAVNPFGTGAEKK